MTLHELYKALSYASESGEKARALLEQEHWFAVNAEFDPKTGSALPLALSAFLAKVAQPVPDETTRDRLWRITEHSRASVERLFHALNESPRREQALLPIHAVRELDANSFIKLSNRPGRTIREKLAGKPYMQAVRRFQSVNLPENRLLKAFVRRLAEALELRLSCLNQEDPLLPKIQSWLHSDEAQAIGNWDNLPPNNTLLSHRDYRRIWDAWRWLQALDEDITRDLSQLEARDKTMRIWNKYAQMWIDGDHRFADMPILFDYEKFEIQPWFSKVAINQVIRKINRKFSAKDISSPVCVDLTILRPRYATATAAQFLPYAFLWQQWKREGVVVDIELFDSDAALLHPQATSISAPDLFFTKGNSSESFDRAARVFASKLRHIFKNDALIWLVPDSINDFELDVIRRNINARFSDAEPLPRSVAAIFERVDYSKISDGFPIVIIDAIGSKTCITKLVAKFDPNLKICLRETHGFYWERQPPIILPSKGSESRTEKRYDITTFNDKEKWHDAIQPLKSQPIDESYLKRDSRIGRFAFAINLMESPVAGGIHLHALQKRAGDIPLWRDHIPELSIKVMKDGRYQRFHLVLRGTTVKPIRGKPVPITINEDFTLPSGRPFYEFPLFLGDSADDLGFSARLDSPAFPFKNNVICKLNLTFEYGADEPYNLVFTPHDKTFPPIRVTWRRTEEVVVNDAPWPEYPVPMTWAALRSFQKQNSNETSDLMEWVQMAFARLDQDFYIRPKPRTTGVISKEWITDKKKGGHFTFAKCNATSESVFIHENSFVRGLNYTDFTKGGRISFELQEHEGKYSGRKVAGPLYKETECLKDFDEELARNLSASIRKRLYFPIIQVWRDGRSIGDQECPKEFSAAMVSNVEFLTTLLRENGLPKTVKNEILFLLSCMHKDAPNEFVRWITDINAENYNIRDKRVLGFALGDVSKEWQKDLLSRLVTSMTNDTLSIFAYAIWREQHFVKRFNLQDLQSVSDILTNRLIKIASAPQKDVHDKSWSRATTETLELLLGLLRSRASSNPEIKMLLQPHQKITKELATQIERITKIVAESNVALFSRVQINLKKPQGDHTPDLLYALRVYLTGDDGANAIHITSVSESDHY